MRVARIFAEERSCDASTDAGRSSTTLHTLLLVNRVGWSGKWVGVAICVLNGEAVRVDACGVELVQLHLLTLLALGGKTCLLLASPALLQEVPEEDAGNDGDE